MRININLRGRRTVVLIDPNEVTVYDSPPAPLQPKMPMPFSWVCPVCQMGHEACCAVRKVRGEGSRLERREGWAPGKVLVFMAGGSLEHYNHPDHFGFVHEDGDEMVKLLAEFFDYPGGFEALNVRWNEWDRGLSPR